MQTSFWIYMNLSPCKDIHITINVVDVFYSIFRFKYLSNENFLKLISFSMFLFCQLPSLFYSILKIHSNKSIIWNWLRSFFFASRIKYENFFGAQVKIFSQSIAFKLVIEWIRNKMKCLLILWKIHATKFWHK